MERVFALAVAIAVSVSSGSAQTVPAADSMADATITCGVTAVDETLLPQLRAIVRDSWTIPGIARVGGKGIVTLRTTLSQEPEVEVVRNSGPNALTAHAELALQRGVSEVASGRSASEPVCTVTWTFFYNAAATERRDWLETLESPEAQP